MYEGTNLGERSMTKYKISIITPCHNMDEELMGKVYRSLKNQTLGFEKIEWIIVLHNSPSGQITIIKDIVNCADNVKIYLLNNEIKTPASPRNLALEHATGDYIGFLDADDTYFPTTCEMAIQAIEKSQARLKIRS